MALLSTCHYDTMITLRLLYYYRPLQSPISALSVAHNSVFIHHWSAFSVGVFINDTRGDGASCGCSRPCHETRYKTQVSSMAFPSQLAGHNIERQWNISGTYIKYVK